MTARRWLDEVNQHGARHAADRAGLLRGNRLVCPGCDRADSAVKIYGSGKWSCHHSTCPTHTGRAHSAADLVWWACSKTPPPSSSDREQWRGWWDRCAAFGLCARREDSTGFDARALRRHNIARQVKAAPGRSARKMRTRIPRAEWDRFWGLLSPLSELTDRVVSPWLEGRNLPLEITTAPGCEVRVLRSASLEGHRSPGWFPRRELRTSAGVRPCLVAPSYTLDGERASFVLRALDGDRQRAKDPNPVGVQARGRVLANAAGLELLRAPRLSVVTDAGPGGEGLPAEGGKRSDLPPVVIVEGFPDFLLWSHLRPDCPVFGVWSGSIQPALVQRLPADRPVVVRTDRDDAGDRFDTKLRALIEQSGRWLDVWRALPVLMKPGEDDGDVWAAGKLSRDPLAECVRPEALPMPRDYQPPSSGEAWLSLPALPLVDVREQLPDTIGAALDSRSMETVIITSSPGAGKTHATISELVKRAGAGVHLLALDSRGKVAPMVEQLRGQLAAAGVQATAQAWVGRRDPDRGDFTPGPLRGDFRSCGNRQVLQRLEADRSPGRGCYGCTLARVCGGFEPSELDTAEEVARLGDSLSCGSYGQSRIAAGMAAGVLVVSHAMLPKAVEQLGGQLASVIIDEAPSLPVNVLTLADLAELRAASERIGLVGSWGPLVQRLADVLRDAGLSEADSPPRSAPADLGALAVDAWRGWRAWRADRKRRRDVGEVVTSPPDLRRGALAVIEQLAGEVAAVDVLARHIDGGQTGPALAAVRRWPMVPAGVPVLALDATPDPDRWRALLGRPVQLTGARVVPHHRQRALLVDSSLWQASRWRETTERTDHLYRVLSELAGEVSGLAAARRGAGDEAPRAVLVGPQWAISDLRATLAPWLIEQGFTVAEPLWWGGTETRGSNDYEGAAVLVSAGSFLKPPAAHLLESRALCRWRGEQPPDATDAEAVWSAVTARGLAEATQAHGRIRANVDEAKRPALHISIAPAGKHPGELSELVARGHGRRLAVVHASTTAAPWLADVRAALPAVSWFCPAVFADPARSPGIDTDDRPSLRSLQRLAAELPADTPAVRLDRPGTAPETWYQLGAGDLHRCRVALGAEDAPTAKSQLERILGHHATQILPGDSAADFGESSDSPPSKDFRSPRDTNPLYRRVPVASCPKIPSTPNIGDQPGDRPALLTAAWLADAEGCSVRTAQRRLSRTAAGPVWQLTRPGSGRPVSLWPVIEQPTAAEVLSALERLGLSEAGAVVTSPAGEVLTVPAVDVETDTPAGEVFSPPTAAEVEALGELLGELPAGGLEHPFQDRAPLPAEGGKFSKSIPTTIDEQLAEALPATELLPTGVVDQLAGKHPRESTPGEGTAGPPRPEPGPLSVVPGGGAPGTALIWEGCLMVIAELQPGAMWCGEVGCAVIVLPGTALRRRVSLSELSACLRRTAGKVLTVPAVGAEGLTIGERVWWRGQWLTVCELAGDLAALQPDDGPAWRVWVQWRPQRGGELLAEVGT